MKGMWPMFTLAVAVSVWGLLHAQDTAEKSRAEYDQLKVLAPMIGSWRHEWIEDGGGGVKIKVAWNEKKNMILIDVTTFRFDDDEDKDVEIRRFLEEYIIWNSRSQRIECFSMNVVKGDVSQYEVKPTDEDGTLTLSYDRIVGVTNGSGILSKSDTIKPVKEWFEWTLTLPDWTGDNRVSEKARRIRVINLKYHYKDQRD